MKKLAFILLFILAFPARAERVGFIADTHIGKAKIKVSTHGFSVHPRLAKKYLNSYFKKVGNDGIKIVIVCGDIDGVNGKKIVVSIAKKYGVTPLIVNGNNDKLPKNYYVVDRGNYQIMVLDSNGSKMSSVGLIDSAQKNWIYSNLSKPTIIAMHHSVFNKHNNNSFFPEYDFLKELPNVRLVITGHNHIEYSETFNNIRFFTANPFTANKRINSYLIEQFSVR